MTEKARSGSWLGEPSDMTLYNKEPVGHFVVDTHDPDAESSEDYAQELLDQLRGKLVEAGHMENIGQPASVRVYDNASISVQPFVKGRGFEYLAVPEAGPPLKRKRITGYTIYRLRFDEAAVTARIRSMRAGYDIYKSLGNREADYEADDIKLAYECFLDEAKWQIPDLVDPWVPQQA